MIDGTIDVTQVYATGTAFTALRTDGSVVTWGNLDKGGDNTAVASALTSVSNLSGDLLNAWTVTTISVIDGSAANDIFNNSVADESIDGGAGIDTLVFSDARANYTLTQNASGWSVDSTAGGTDTIDNVERLQFSDTSLALDVDAVSGQAYRIYRAALGRKPDDSGLGYWIAMMDQGMDIVEVSARFIDSDEFRATYGTESPRVLRRLQPLREWSHEQDEQIFPRSPRACSAAGPRAPRRVSVAVGDRGIDCAEDRLYSADLARMGQARRSGRRQA